MTNDRRTDWQAGQAITRASPKRSWNEARETLPGLGIVQPLGNPQAITAPWQQCTEGFPMVSQDPAMNSPRRGGTYRPGEQPLRLQAFAYSSHHRICAAKSCRHGFRMTMSANESLRTTEVPTGPTLLSRTSTCR